ncbi:MAG: hypothetical protein ACI91B_004415 [Planctomycetota bacterium]|jgi:hypothetical protein
MEEAVPGTLFKYLPPSRLDVLEDLRVRFSQFSALNDPHECFASLDLVDLVTSPEHGPRILDRLGSLGASLPDALRSQLTPMHANRSVDGVTAGRDCG